MNKNVVLVIDDEYKIRSLLELYLQKNDYEVITAVNGSAGLQVVKYQRVDLVVLDILLPDMSGLEVCKKIRRENDMPIIFLSSLMESNTIITGLENGGDAYITKPFDPNVLVAKINAILRRTKAKVMVEPKKFETPRVLVSDQEKQILYLIEKGYTNKEIAEFLNLKVGTIKVYNNVIFQKLQVKNRTQAIVRAKEEHII